MAPTWPESNSGPWLGRTWGQSQFGLSLEIGLLRPGAGLAQNEAFIHSDYKFIFRARKRL